MTRSFAAAALLSIVATVTVSAEPPKIEVGRPFPELILPRLDNGQPGSMADFLGRKVILTIFASW